ncbi:MULTISPECIES: MerR family transcriptional regulator [unclassified Micromonospora]|uniref:MerR family transcriptional regulator n=1 Tax=unclassified Micromonospora TaxID=2617518 RepID=UPI001033E5A2|nr:MerR family transcriptional regulator [Verrucosispora sp. SN26_14.1]TBL30234.1 MerR family DNA-binding transcriptional regulator [Verrucosispora sp. SN26_14.1]
MSVKPASLMTLTVGDVAVRSRVAPSAVRFYESHGVITAVRTTGNQRRFEESAVCRIEIARVAQRVGMTVREIAALFGGLSANPTPEEWGQVAHRLVSEAEERLADLRTHLAALESGTRLCDIGRAEPVRSAPARP